MENDRYTAAERLGRLIDQNQREIERRWLEKVQTDVCRTPGIEPTHLRDGLPHYLAALAGLLGHRSWTVNDARNDEPAWSKVAREHGITRVQIGFDINQLLHEFIVLRHVIREIAKEQGTEIDGLDSVLTDSLDGAIAASVSAYVNARDHEARRKQAENIGFLTHELRNPLSTAMMATSRLRHQATPDQVRVIDALDRSHKRLSELIDSVLLSERLEAGKIESHPVDVKIEQVMEPALEAARRTASSKGLAFRVNYDPGVSVRLDPLLTRSAIQNLADNAVKYADRGYVELTVEDRPEDLVVHVRDSCEGISEQELRTIFEPFERGATRKSGTGLGLAIARRAVEAQGGAIQAASCEASASCETTGCHFWITLPKRPAAPADPG